jgi:hypothetical protein
MTDYSTLRAWLAATRETNEATLAELEADGLTADERRAAVAAYETAAREGTHDNAALEALYFAATAGLADDEERQTARAQREALTAHHRVQSEAEVCRDLEEALERGGWAYIRLTDSRRQHAVGWPDYFAVRGRELLGLEAKRERGRLRPAQHDWIGVLEGAGIPCLVVRPSTLDAVRARLLAPKKGGG